MGIRRWRKQYEERVEWKIITKSSKNSQSVVMPIKEEEE
jgi:hypothetical protein